MTRPVATTMIRASLALATIAVGLVMASPTRAQDYFVNGHPASVAEARTLSSQGMPPGNWRIDGWGIGPAEGGNVKHLAAATGGNTGKCWYVLDVPLGDCGVLIAAADKRSTDAGATPRSPRQVQLATAQGGVAPSDR
jgi:hypothetical protein